MLGFSQHVVGVVVGHDGSEVRRSALVPRSFCDAARPCACKVVGHAHGRVTCGFKDRGRLGQRHGVRLGVETAYRPYHSRRGAQVVQGSRAREVDQNAVGSDHARDGVGHL